MLRSVTKTKNGPNIETEKLIACRISCGDLLVAKYSPVHAKYPKRVIISKGWYRLKNVKKDVKVKKKIKDARDIESNFGFFAFNENANSIRQIIAYLYAENCPTWFLVTSMYEKLKNKSIEMMTKSFLGFI